MLEGWGRTVYRRRWLVLAASLVLLAASGYFVARGGELRDPDSVHLRAGHFAEQLNFTPQSLDPAVLVILFCIVFGLSMDYEVLLLSEVGASSPRTRSSWSRSSPALPSRMW